MRQPWGPRKAGILIEGFLDSRVLPPWAQMPLRPQKGIHAGANGGNEYGMNGTVPGIRIVSKTMTFMTVDEPCADAERWLLSEGADGLRKSSNGLRCTFFVC